MIIVSACLAGINCKYDGSNCAVPAIRELVACGKAVPVCPEQLGGDPTPREPVELDGTSGEEVLDEKGRALTKSGVDKTASLVRGAWETLNIARLIQAEYAILKERSPSCGCHIIYDGSFTGQRRQGRGITSALLEKYGIKVYSEDDVDKKGGVAK